MKFHSLGPLNRFDAKSIMHTKYMISVVENFDRSNSDPLHVTIGWVMKKRTIVENSCTWEATTILDVKG